MGAMRPTCTDQVWLVVQDVAVICETFDTVVYVDNKGIA